MSLEFNLSINLKKKPVIITFGKIHSRFLLTLLYLGHKVCVIADDKNIIYKGSQNHTNQLLILQPQILENRKF